MSQIEAKTEEAVWKTLYSTQISEPNKTLGYIKYITVKQLLKTSDSIPFFLADIRAYINGSPTKNGVCLTPFEFDWLANKLLYTIKSDTMYFGKNSERRIKLKSKPKVGGVEIIQEVNDSGPRRINLYKDEISRIIEDYGSFYTLVETLEHEKESEGYDIIEYPLVKN